MADTVITAVATGDEEPPRRPASVWIAPVGNTSNASTAGWVRLDHITPERRPTPRGGV